MDTYRINGHADLQKGSLLVDDGSGHINFGSESVQFSRREDVDIAEQNIVNAALAEFSSAYEADEPTSFLLPEKLKERLELEPFDIDIASVLKKGHLHEIVRRPKSTLVYQEYLVPVGRVKKVANSATQYLASHSESWQKRGITGVIPKSLMALESEDELNIYENRVFARLLDNMELHLQKRCAEVSRIVSAINEAGEFEGASDFYYEMTNSICTLWGEGFNDNTDQKDNNNGSETLTTLRHLLKQTRSLQQSRVYRAIPKQEFISTSVNMTNTLMHDPHYRHVASLWHQWVKLSKSQKIPPEITHQKNHSLCEAYTLYVYALASRALTELGYTNSGNLFHLEGKKSLELKRDHYDINLSAGHNRLKFVPVFSHLPMHDLTMPDYGADETLIFICIKTDTSDSKDAQPVASPLYFYSLESMVTHISKWLSYQNLSAASDQIDKIPSAIKNNINQFPEGILHINNGVLRLNKPMAYKHLIQNIALDENDSSVKAFLSQLESLSQAKHSLLQCPVCGCEALERDFKPRDKGDFDVQSSLCNHRWRIDRNAQQEKKFIVSPKNETEINGFLANGRYGWDMSIN